MWLVKCLAGQMYGQNLSLHITTLTVVRTLCQFLTDTVRVKNFPALIICWWYAVVDSFTHVLGGFSSFNSILKADEAEVNIVSPNGSHYRVRKTAPNEIFLQGILQSGAVVSVNFRNVPFGNKTIDDKGVRWTITGTEGEIEITTPEVCKSHDFILRILTINQLWRLGQLLNSFSSLAARATRSNAQAS